MDGTGSGMLPFALWAAVLIVMGCLVLSAFFSAAETALTGASKARIVALARSGDRRARIVLHLLEGRQRVAAALLLGASVAMIGACAMATGLLMAFFGHSGIVYAVALMSLLVVVFTDRVPRLIAMTAPDHLSLAFARPILVCIAILGPILMGVEALVRTVLRPFGLRVGQTGAVMSAQDELRGTVDLLHREGGVETEARNMLGGLINLSDLEVSDVMIHRTKMRTICADQPAQEIVREVLASPYTRLPLWSGSPENIVAILHAKDLLRALDLLKGDATRLDVMATAVEPWFVPDMTSLPDQLKAFLARKTHFALVVDEYGEVMGLVTLEDILEEIVGDIKDEHDLTVQGVRPQPDGSVSVDGSVPVRDLNRVMDWRLPDEEATTIAGLVIHEAQTIPEAGQVFTFYNFRFKVSRRARNRITALRITPLPKG